MYILKTEASFDSAHFLNGYQGKCGNIHGHRWRIIAAICDDHLAECGNEKGMVVDFKDLKAALKNEADELDHAMIIEKNSLRPELFDMLCESGFKIISLDFTPTAENMSKYFYDRLKKRGYRVKEITVYETPNNCAVYSE